MNNSTDSLKIYYVKNDENMWYKGSGKWTEFQKDAKIYRRKSDASNAITTYGIKGLYEIYCYVVCLSFPDVIEREIKITSGKGW